MAANSERPPEYIGIAKNFAEGFTMGLGEVLRNKKKDGVDDKLQKRELAKQSRDQIKSLNLTWLDQMVSSPAQLREKVSLFWHGHFACRNLNIYNQQLLLQQIRSNALGSFGELLTAVSKSPAMLAFLNNQQNKKSHPNENFAREVMELFTMGRGNYSETDVKEAARAFTGWGFNLQGEFANRPFQHDNGVKIFLGKKGNFDGDDIIKILLEQKNTATFIARKMYRYFVNDQPDDANVQWLANRFYQSNYNISSLLKDVFTSSWFYDEKNIGSKIKSPIELLVGIRRMQPVEFENKEVQLLFQRALGQVLFYPPNVAGWPGGKNWIDSSALMLRLRLPQLLAGNDLFGISAKADDDQQMGMKEQFGKGLQGGQNDIAGLGKRFKVSAKIDWPVFQQQFINTPRPQLYNLIETALLQAKMPAALHAIVEKAIDQSTRENYIQSLSLLLMSTPEYQLC